MAAVGLEGRGRSARVVQGQKTRLSQRIQELKEVAALREQGQNIFTRLCEEKLAETRQRLLPLRKTLRDDIHTLDTVRASPRSKVTFSEACREERPMGVLMARKAVELALEKVQAEIHGRTNTYNALQYEVRRRRQVLGELQRRLQQLESVAAADNRQHQQQMRVIHQLENNIEKMLVKVRAAQKVTTQYLAVRDVLKKELAHLPQHLDLLIGMAESYQRELEDMEPVASHALRAAEVAKAHMAETRSWFLAQSELRHRSLAAQKVPRDRRWLKEASTKHPKERAAFQLSTDSLPQHSQDPLVDTKTEAAEAQLEREARLTEKLEKAKAAVQCCLLWDIPSRLLEQQESSLDLGNCIKEYKEKVQVLRKRLKELELKHAQLKFRQPPDTARVLEEELLRSLQREEEKLEQMKAHLLRNQKVLLQFEDGLDNLFIRLHGITVPGQEDCVKALGLEEKLQHCQQKLQYLVQRVCDLSPDSHSPSESSKALVKVRNLLEKATASDPQNLKISLDAIGSSVQDLFDFEEKDPGVVLSREDIKRQGLRLVESNKKSRRKKLPTWTL